MDNVGMLHNSGVYSLQDSPMNLETTRNVTPSSSVVNIAESFKNVNNIQQQTLDLSQTKNGLSDIRSFNHPHNSTILDQYKSYSSVFNSDYSCHKGQNSTLTSWQNGVTVPNGANLVSNAGIKIECNAENNEDYPMSSSYKSVLNIPKYMVKAKTNEAEMEVTHQMNENTNRVFMDSMKRKSLENTVRLIENILMNTTRRNEVVRDQEQNNIFIKNNLEPTNDISESDDSNSRNNNNMDKEEVSDKIEIPPITDEILNPHENIEYNVPDEENKIQHSVPTVVIKTEPLDEQDYGNENCNIEVNPDIVVKVEEMPVWEDMVENPFLKDVHGVKDVGPSAVVIDGFNSVSKATEGLVNGSQQSTYYECQYCGLFFQHPKRFLIHTKWHTFGLVGLKREEIKKEKELIRQKKKEELERIKEEEATDPVTGLRMYPCTACDKKFPTKNAMKYHRKRAHTISREVIRECNICNLKFPDWKSMYVHKKSHLPETEYSCDECPKKFKYPHSLAKHKQTHLEKTHQCPDCPKAFGSAYLLKTHAKTHERMAQGQTHSCSYCGKGYYNQYTLAVHERTHRNEKPFVCTICNTSYGTNSSLTRHLKVSHGGAKPYECATCHRCFSSERIRDRHAARAHGDPALLSHACTLCDCRYMSSKYLRKHIEKVHPKEREKLRRMKRGSFSE